MIFLNTEGLKTILKCLITLKELKFTQDTEQRKKITNKIYGHVFHFPIAHHAFVTSRLETKILRRLLASHSQEREVRHSTH